MTGTDLKLLLRDGFARAALALFVLAIAVAALLGQGWADRHRESLAAHVAAERFVVKDYPVSPTDITRAIVLPAAPLLDLSVGRADLAPSQGQTNFFTREDQLFDDYELDGPVALAAGRFDLAFVTIWLAPLILIALGLSIASADRDSGLLRMQAAGVAGVARPVLARAGLRLVLVFAPIATAAVVLAAVSPDAPDKAARLALWLGGALAYLAFWQALVLLASTVRARQEAVGAGLLGAWAFFVLVVPAFASATAQALAPPPSRFALIADTRAVEVAARDAAPELLNQYSHDHPELVIGGGTEGWVKNYAMVNARAEAAVGPTLARFEAAAAEQRRIASGFALLSPALLANGLLADAAGSGEGRFAEFGAAARAYHRDVKAKLVFAGLRGTPLPRADEQALPSFAFRDTAPAVLTPVLALLVAAAALAAITLRRATPRMAL